MNRSPAGRCWVLAALLILVGCSATVDGSAEADPSAIRLDTGGYPTAPRAVPERTNINDSRVQSSYDLSAYLVAPAEIDKNFTWVAPASTPVLRHWPGSGRFFGIPFAAPLSQNESFVGGAVSARQTTKIERESPDTARMFTASSGTAPPRTPVRPPARSAPDSVPISRRESPRIPTPSPGPRSHRAA